jgi:hypothetical protein
LGEGLTEEALFGGLEMKKFLEKGEYEYLVQNSFMNHEVVIFEEIFDAPAPILLSLKDIITSGYFRKGHQTFKIKTKMIIGLTNKSKEAFSEDDSLEALVQRFPATVKVEWDSYTKEDWRNLFNKVFDKEFTKKHKTKLYDLTNIFELNNSIGSGFVSPRTAVKAAKIYAFGGSLDMISDLDKDIVKKYFKENKDSVVLEEYTNLINKAGDYFESIKGVCSKYLNDELEDSILGMLNGSGSDYLDKDPISDEDKRLISICSNKISWLQNHISINHAPTMLEEKKKELSKEVSSFKEKLNDLIK